MGRPELAAWYDIAAMMGRSVAECQASIGSVEFVHWRAWLLLHPWPKGHAMIAAAIGGGKIEDYMPQVKRQKSLAEMIADADHTAAVLRG